MKSTDLKPGEIDALDEVVSRQLRFAEKLCARMEQLRFSHSDPVFAAAVQARESIRELLSAVHATQSRSGKIT